MARITKIVNFSLTPEIYEQVNKLAKQRQISRSQVLREALKQYFASERRWQQIRKWGEETAKRLKIKNEDDVERTIDEYRDTNVYISAILFGGNPEKIRRLSKEGRVELLISEAIIAEVAEVLRRKFNWENWQISQTIDEIREIATLVIPRQTLFIIKKDDNDNRILECAVEGKAQYIVSGDKHHLLPLKEYQGIRILTPAQFLEAISHPLKTLQPPYQGSNIFAKF